MRRFIKRELPAVGTELIHFHFGKPVYKAKIVKDDSEASGRSVEHRGKRYKTLTGAAVAITQKETNGWIFWRFEK